MWYKGISFTNENSAITYLVDAAGARTTTDHFVSPSVYENLLNDVFYELVFIIKHLNVFLLSLINVFFYFV